MIVAGRRAGPTGTTRARGRSRPGEPVVVDIWPRDRASRCWADMTRTFVAGGGEPDAELAEYWRSARDVARARLRRWCGRASTAARSSARRASRSSRPGQPTQLTKAAGRGAARRLLPLARPRRRPRDARAARTSGRLGDTLVAGDVIAVEPGCYRQRLRRLPARGPRAGHGRRLRGPDGLPVRPVSSTASGRRRDAPAPRQGQGPRDLRPRGRPADGRLRPDLDLRRRPSDADPGQGQGPHRASPCSGSG